MPARRPKAQVSKIKRDRIRRSTARKIKRWSKRAPGSTVRDSPGGGFVVREGVYRKSARAGGATRHVVRRSAGGRADAPTGAPRGGIFSLGDPTLAGRVEEELNGRDR